MYYKFKPVSHKQLRKTLVWTNGDGRDILLKDLTDRHVINTTLYLNKKLRDLIEFSLPNIEIGKYNIEEWIEFFTNEIEYRGL